MIAVLIADNACNGLLKECRITAEGGQAYHRHMPALSTTDVNGLPVTGHGPCSLSQDAIPAANASGFGFSATTSTRRCNSASKYVDVVGPIAASRARRSVFVFCPSILTFAGMSKCLLRMGRVCFAELGAKWTIHQLSSRSGSVAQVKPDQHRANATLTW